MNARLDIVPGGCFVAVPSTIGATEEELEAMSRGELPPERAQVIEAKLREAAFNLNCCLLQGAC